VAAKRPYCGADTGESFERFMGEGVVAFVAGEGVHSNQRNGGDGIPLRGVGGILKGLAADRRGPPMGAASKGRSKEAAAFGIGRSGRWRRSMVFLRGGEIAGIKRGLVRRRGAARTLKT